MNSKKIFTVALIVCLFVITSWAGDIMVIAHRGFSGVAPENTMAAFQAAADLGVGFELDVMQCATGEVVIIHDDTVGRTTDGEGAIGEMLLEEIRLLDAGSWFGEKFAGEPIPTLREVLERFGGLVPIDIEIKDCDSLESLADAVVAEIERAGVVDRVLVTSFNPYILLRVREQNPAILRGMLTGTFKDEDLTFIEKFVLRRLLFRGKVKPATVAVERVCINKRKVRKWHRQGYEVLAWTVNDEAEMRRMIDAGVDGIITDNPAKLLELLEKY